MADGEQTPRGAARKLRSRLPVSPLPWKWNERLRWIALGIAVAVVVGGIVAVILVQRSSDSGSEQAKAASAPPEVRKLIKAMSPAQKADEVVITGFDSAASGAQEAGAAQLGGLIVGPEDWPGGAAGPALLGRLHAAGKTGGRIPPLIVGRQEGGIYRSYPDLPPADGQAQIGAADDPAAAKSWALATGRALAGAGFDLNLAPLADIATLDSPLSDRVFSDDPEVVTAMVRSAVQGCGQSGLGCAVPYFPGLGGASQSTEDGPATVSLDTASLDARDLRPFRAAIEQKAPALVISLAFYAAYDPVTPAALSPAVAGGLLRDQLGFKGVAITDDLTAGAITQGIGAPQAAVQALAAGSDMALIGDPGQAAAARKQLTDAIQSGAVPQSRIDEGLARILVLKQRLGLIAAPKRG